MVIVDGGDGKKGCLFLLRTCPDRVHSIDVTPGVHQSHPHVMGWRTTIRSPSHYLFFQFTICQRHQVTMAPLKVHIKHAGKKYDLELDPQKPPLAFKEAVYQSTGVPVDRMKVMVKGGVLKVRREFLKSYKEQM